MKLTFGNLKKILRCSFGLKCPRCEEGSLFQKRFTMFSNCPECDLKFEREQGYFIGAMYINYGATVFLAFPGYFIFRCLHIYPFSGQFCNMGCRFRYISNLFLPLFKEFVVEL